VEGVKVLVGIIANDAARFSEFWSCVLRLKVPQGSVKENVIGGDWCSARNELARRCIEEGYDYLWFMDDDHSFGPDLLQKLLEAAETYDLPIVNPLCTMRTAPFHLVTFAANPDPESKDRYLPISLEGLPGEGIVELEAGGCAGMLIRRDVLEATRLMSFDYRNTSAVDDVYMPFVVPDRWFEYGDRSEDLVFCEKAKEAGFKIHADLSARLGHITTAVVVPALTENGWETGITVGRDLQLAIGTAEQILREQEVEWVEESDPRNHDDNPHPDELPPVVVQDPCGICGKQSTWSSGIRMGCEGHSPISEAWGAERIEIWVDDEFRWWWRAIGYEGEILKKDSGINEAGVIGQAHFFYPGADVHQVQREADDSRNLRQYGVPGRMFNREVR
jgi:hypothetical protein